MTDRSSPSARTLLALLCAGVLGASHAQGLRAPGGLALPPAATQPPAPVNRTADYIVALVNSEPVTNHEVRQRLILVQQQLAQRNVSPPPREQLLRQVLDQLINERAQMQLAAELGIRVSDAEVDQAELSIAAQNQLDRDGLRRRAAADGIDINRLRSDLRSQILLQRLREREVDSRVRVTDADIDDYLREQQGSNDLSTLELNLSHVLVLVPDNTPDARVAELQARAQRVADRARAGEDFATLAREFSDAPERVNGGQFGLRPASRLPDLFVSSTRSLPVGGIAGPLRSAAGFHVLKLMDKRQAGMPGMAVAQTRASHILLRPGAQLTQDAAVARLNEFRQRMAAGQATFEALAREHSQDGSAAGGGNLGWANPGQFVPEFEEAMARLRPGEVSEPVVSRFGVHLIRVDERRQTQMSARDQREVARNLVREKKTAEALALWARDVRGRAYVEIREAPQP